MFLFECTVTIDNAKSISGENNKMVRTKIALLKIETRHTLLTALKIQFLDIGFHMRNIKGVFDNKKTILDLYRKKHGF